MLKFSRLKAFTSFGRVDVEGNTCSNYCKRLFKSTHAISTSTIPRIFHSIIGHLVDGYYRIHIAELLTRSSLCPEFYDFSCPQANEIVMSVLHDVISQEPKMAASFPRLHFHDCFVQGCDASVLLDDSRRTTSEKHAAANANSLRGFEVIDEIKFKIEEACPETVSCADILALAARGSTLLVKVNSSYKSQGL
ncbi:hypothetical protein Dimus_003109 [Dionaea muscipula]